MCYFSGAVYAISPLAAQISSDSNVGWDMVYAPPLAKSKMKFTSGCVEKSNLALYLALLSNQ